MRMCTFRENTLDLGVFHRGILETQKFLKRVWYKFSYGMSAVMVMSCHGCCEPNPCYLPLSERQPDTICLRCKPFRCSSCYKRNNLPPDLNIRVPWIHKKKRHLFFKQNCQGTGEPKLFQHLDPMSFLCPIHSCQGHTDVLTGFYPIFHLTYCFL